MDFSNVTFSAKLQTINFLIGKFMPNKMFLMCVVINNPKHIPLCPHHVKVTVNSFVVSVDMGEPSSRRFSHEKLHSCEKYFSMQLFGESIFQTKIDLTTN